MIYNYRQSFTDSRRKIDVKRLVSKSNASNPKSTVSNTNDKSKDIKRDILNQIVNTHTHLYPIINSDKEITKPKSMKSIILEKPLEKPEKHASIQLTTNVNENNKSYHEINHKRISCLSNSSFRNLDVIESSQDCKKLNKAIRVNRSIGNFRKTRDEKRLNIQKSKDYGNLQDEGNIGTGKINNFI